LGIIEAELASGTWSNKSRSIAILILIGCLMFLSTFDEQLQPTDTSLTNGQPGFFGGRILPPSKFLRSIDTSPKLKSFHFQIQNEET